MSNLDNKVREFMVLLGFSQNFAKTEWQFNDVINDDQLARIENTVAELIYKAQQRAVLEARADEVGCVEDKVGHRYVGTWASGYRLMPTHKRFELLKKQLKELEEQ